MFKAFIKGFQSILRLSLEFAWTLCIGQPFPLRPVDASRPGPVSIGRVRKKGCPSMKIRVKDKEKTSDQNHFEGRKVPAETIISPCSSKEVVLQPRAFSKIVEGP